MCCYRLQSVRTPPLLSCIIKPHQLQYNTPPSPLSPLNTHKIGIIFLSPDLLLTWRFSTEAREWRHSGRLNTLKELGGTNTITVAREKKMWHKLLKCRLRFNTNASCIVIWERIYYELKTEISFLDSLTESLAAACPRGTGGAGRAGEVDRSPQVVARGVVVTHQVLELVLIRLIVTFRDTRGAVTPTLDMRIPQPTL